MIIIYCKVYLRLGEGTHHVQTCNDHGFLLLSGAGTASAATIVNGSFENASVNPGGGFNTLGLGSTAIDGWEVTQGSIDYIGGYWQAQDGGRSVDLAGNAIGEITQTLTDTVIGQLYEVSFWVSKNPDLPGNPLRTGTISFGNQSRQFSYGLPNNRTNMNWVRDTFRFVAAGTSTDLSFAADATAGCCFGPALDNISIAAVPEPASWAMMIGGFALVGGALRSRRRSTALATA